MDTAIAEIGLVASGCSFAKDSTATVGWLPSDYCRFVDYWTITIATDSCNNVVDIDLLGLGPSLSCFRNISATNKNLAVDNVHWSYSKTAADFLNFTHQFFIKVDSNNCIQLIMMDKMLGFDGFVYYTQVIIKPIWTFYCSGELFLLLKYTVEWKGLEVVSHVSQPFWIIFQTLAEIL